MDMPGKIAVEPNLTPVKDYLTQKGYTVESVSFDQQPANKLQGYDALVVTGLNSDFLGMNDTETKTFVLNADGMTPEQVEQKLQSRL